MSSRIESGHALDPGLVSRDDPRMSGEEQQVFQDAHVTVTTTRAVLNGVTYAMSNITSVRLVMIPRPGIVLVLAVFAAVMGSSCIVVNCADSAQVGWGGVVLAGVLAVWYFSQKTKYMVCIGTAGAEQNAIWSHDKAWAASVVDALNQAIVLRG